MYTWIKNSNIEKNKKASVDYSDIPEHRRHPLLELKLAIIHRCFEEREDIKSVSEETGYSRTSIYLWRRSVKQNKDKLKKSLNYEKTHK